MKRTDLSALTELLAAGTITDSESQRLADFLRQIAQSEPVAWAATDESGAVVEALGMNQSRRFDTALYILPLED